ncbi:exopolysaccharide biosynthesis polyprenyl glycosylphosphotransferase [Thiomicrospira cyclica]|uniref:Exopolysaccharide biosynthesis polyprenyl glycosylphosphotransferase n=1 Tax=Thiomicrospira cyclica (strain DSM 14477 / JCM 11371 / ALM1) TaxID=717773 RepID=F6DCU3_THICA|nr:exopolysaccharide biosynthesis polyprenyl glycosylphosphotransferase [Thiomicrospira cyclica]AEG31679.1 exopolysaccharide biosynthesis polyprenyl glycosylphosphotransferase [Thiomicrospira cyclica ALM1]
MHRIIRYSSRKALIYFGLFDLILPLALLYVVQGLVGDKPWSEPYFWLGLLAGIAMVLGSALANGYSRYSSRTLAKKLQLVFQVWGIILLGLLVVAFVIFATHEFGRKVVLVWAFFTPFLLLLARLAINYFCYYRQHTLIKVLFLSPYKFTGFEKKRLRAQHFQWQFLKSRSSLEVVLADFKPDYVVLPEQTPVIGVVDKREQQDWVKQLTRADLQGVHLVKFEQFMEGLLRKCFINYQSTDLTYLEQIAAYSQSQYVVKRVVDIVMALGVLVLVWPLMLYAAWRIRRESPGSVFFSQTRVGRGGKEFTLYKFRSMHLDAEKNGAQFATSKDPRAFDFGALMRRTRIDELPQLWNVLKGDLHFVGPRPERKCFTDTLEIDIPFYNERHLVAPGITGWAQVMYPYGSCTEDARQKLMYDLYYIKNWSIWLEIETLVRTVGVVFSIKGI